VGAAVADRFLDARAEVMEIDHHLFDAAGAQHGEHVREQRPAADLHERLRQRVGERCETPAVPGCQHHRPPDAHAASASSGTQRATSSPPRRQSGKADSARRATPYTAGRYAR
jgi:hypothetical protein